MLILMIWVHVTRGNSGYIQRYATGTTQAQNFIDITGFFSTITTFHEGHEYRKRQTFQSILNLFECGNSNVLIWIPGTDNISILLTKTMKLCKRKLKNCARKQSYFCFLGIVGYI